MYKYNEIKSAVHLELLMRAADILTPLHISMDLLNPGCSQSQVVVSSSCIQLTCFCACMC